MCTVCPVGGNVAADLVGSDFSVIGGNRQDLVTRCLHCSGLVGVDVACNRAQRPLMGPQGRVNDGHIGLGASHQEVNREAFPAAELFDFLRG